MKRLFLSWSAAIVISIITILAACFGLPEKFIMNIPDDLQQNEAFTHNGDESKKNTADPLFPKAPKRVKSRYNEGEFKMGDRDLVVSTYGDDSNPGTLDSPLKTIERAKEILKSYKTDGTVTVWFREGSYFVENTVEFTSEDRGDVIYRSYPYEEVSFIGAEEISNWSETTINGVEAFVTDVEISSEEDYFRALFKDEKRLSRSVYPKTGALKVADPKTDEAMVPEHNANIYTNSAVFYAHEEDIIHISNPQDADIRIMHFWCDELLPIYSIDTSTGRIETQKPTEMTIRVDDNYVFENVKEALCLPNEWYLDRSEGKLYYIPEEGESAENTVLYAAKTKKLLSISEGVNITFQGINFEQTDWDHVGKMDSTRNDSFPPTHHLYKNLKYNATCSQAAYETPAAINVSKSRGINFIDCLFRNISYTALKFEHGSQSCQVMSSKFEDIGGVAVFIDGDKVIPATTTDVNVVDCHIEKYGRIFNNAVGILLTHAADCEISNNEIHEGWYTAISVGWTWGYADNPTNNIKVTDNLIYDIGNGWLSDMGGIYTLGIQPGTVVSGNVIHDVGSDKGTHGYGGWGIYLDEGSSYILVEKNLVYDCSSQPFHQHYGKENIVRNNILAFGQEGVFKITAHENHNSLTLLNNILLSNGTDIFAFAPKPDWFINESNLYWDYKNSGSFLGVLTDFLEEIPIKAISVLGYSNNSIFADPFFKDIDSRDFTLAINSPALDIGFTPWEYNAGTNTLFE